MGGGSCGGGGIGSSSSGSSSNYNNNANEFPPLTSNYNQTFDSESLVAALSLCISMIVDVLKETVISGQPLKETDSRSLAQTCVDAFSTRNGKSGHSYKIAAERQTPVNRWVSHDATRRDQENSLR